MTDINKVLVPFMCCGDLSGFDSEKSHLQDTEILLSELRDKLGVYELTSGLNPVAPPTEPAYKEALQKKRQGALAKPQ